MVNYTLLINARQSPIALDTSNLTELTLLASLTAADYSAETPNSFTITKGGDTFVVTSDAGGFTYAGGVPNGGIVDNMTVTTGGVLAYYIQFGITSTLTIPEFDALFSTSDAQALSRSLLSGNDSISGSLSQANHLYGFAGKDYIQGGLHDDLLVGGRGDDILQGVAGHDRLLGGRGDDLLVPGPDDSILNGGPGSDTVSFEGDKSPVVVKLDGNHPGTARVGYTATHTLKNIENVDGSLVGDKLTGDGNDNQLNGSAGTDHLSGKGGHDVLDGGYDNDVLIGGNGPDFFVFDTLLGPAVNIDRVMDFQHGVDTIELSHLVFDPLHKGALSSANFLAGPHATYGHGNDYVVYDTSTGNLFYDTQGDGTGLILQFAHLKGAPHLDASDFLII